MLREKMAMAVGGRAVRACDGCGTKRSRWYCAADEAYLCEACDTSVHAANALAHRHERVRLTPSGTPMKSDKKKLKSRPSNSSPLPPPPRLPQQQFPQSPLSSQADDRSSYFSQVSQSPLSCQSDVSNNIVRDVKVEIDGNSSETSDRFTAEELTGNANLLDSPHGHDRSGFDSTLGGGTGGKGVTSESDFGHDFLVSDADLGDGSGIVDEEGGEWTGSAGADLDLCGGAGDRDLSDDEYCMDLDALQSDQSNPAYDVQQGTPFPRGRPFKGVGQAEWMKAEEEGGGGEFGVNCKIEGWNDSDLRQVPSLRLDYEDVLSSWSDRGTLWTKDTTNFSQLVPDDSGNSDLFGGGGSGSFEQLGLVPDMGMVPGNGVGQPGSMFGSHEDHVSAASGREARVSRYREKRRTRLFSKKIRYEVRKLNAERRPRMKGRFVKRSPGLD